MLAVSTGRLDARRERSRDRGEGEQRNHSMTSSAATHVRLEIDACRGDQP